MHLIAPADAVAFIGDTPGLIAGPALGADTVLLSKLSERLASVAKAEPPDRDLNFYLSICEHFEPGLSRETLALEVNKFLAEPHKDAPHLDRVCSVPWSAILSATADRNLEIGLRKVMERQLDKRRLVELTAGLQPLRSIDVPVIRMLGSPIDQRAGHRVPVAQSEYLACRRRWRSLVPALFDKVRFGYVIVAGFDGHLQLLLDVLNEYVACSPSIPQRLVFFGPGAKLHGEKIDELANGLVETLCVEGSLYDTLRDFDAATNKPGNQFDFFSSDKNLAAVELQLLERLIRVPGREDVKGAFELNRAFDLLFRPAYLDWLPFKKEIDLPRTVTGKVCEATRSLFANQNSSSILVRGSAGVGKSTSLKKIGFELASAGCHVYWIKPVGAEKPTVSLKDVFQRLSIAIVQSGKKTHECVFLIDNYIGPTDRLGAVMDLLESAKLKSCLIVAARDSAVGHNDDDFKEVNAAVFDTLIDLSNDLDDAEWGELPRYLTRIGMADDEADALKKIRAQGSRHAKDVLCALWYLVPSTRAAIRDSLTSEVAGIGSSKGMVARLATSFDETDLGRKARAAYGVVATTSAMQISIPIEVLASAIRVPITQWRSIWDAGRPLWSLLYEEPLSGNQSVGIRTRNQVVTEVLISTINDGADQHEGEFQYVRDAVRGCTSSNPAYRDFLIEVLVSRKSYLTRFGGNRGLELYDLAIQNFPLPDRTLHHHRALWIKNELGDFETAYRKLEETKSIEVYPLAKATEPEEHIHTSQLSCIVQQVRKGEVTPEEGNSRASGHIEKASSVRGIDPHIIHVTGSLMLKLAAFEPSSDKRMEGVAKALHFIDRGITLCRGVRQRKRYDELDRVLQLKATALRDFDIDAAKALALSEIRDNKNPGLGHIVGQMLFAAVDEDDQATVDNQLQHVINFLDLCIHEIGLQKLLVPIELKYQKVLVGAKWKIIRGQGQIEWRKFVASVAEVLASDKYSHDLLLKFYSAVGHYHAGIFARSTSEFEEMRNQTLSGAIRYVERCFYRGGGGNPKIFQGRVTEKSAEKMLIYCPELDFDVRAKVEEFSATKGMEVTFKIVFSFLGALAIA